MANRAIVLDVDDTTLTTWNYELYSNWDFNPTTNASSWADGRDVHREHVPGDAGDDRPGQPGQGPGAMRSSSSPAAAIRSTPATIANLINDTAAGFSDIDARDHLREDHPGGRRRLPGADADRHRPRRSFADGLFTKPPIGSYPAYLDKPEFCGPAIAANASCPTIQYKSGTRAYIESQGYDIVANFGDQFSDLRAASRTRRSRCRTRTTTCRKGEDQNEHRPLPLTRFEGERLSSNQCPTR